MVPYVVAITTLSGQLRNLELFLKGILNCTDTKCIRSEAFQE